MNNYHKTLGFNSLIRGLNNVAHELAFSQLIGSDEIIKKFFKQKEIISSVFETDDTEQFVFTARLKYEDDSIKKVIVKFIGRDDLYIDRSVMFVEAKPSLEDVKVPKSIFDLFNYIAANITDDQRLMADRIMVTDSNGGYSLQVIYHNFKNTSVHVTIFESD